MADGARDLLIRAYGSPSTHRVLPAALALPVLAAVEPMLRRRRNPAEDVDAERFMSDLLQYTPRRDEARRAAREHLRERTRLRELFWRPWLLKNSRVIGREHWDAARSGGRGSVVVLGHLGGSWAVAGILGRHRLDVHMVSSAHFWQELPPGLTGRAHRQLREYGERGLGREARRPRRSSAGRWL